jgi:hypothetical protein
MDIKNLLTEIRDNIEEVILKDSAIGKTLWQELLDLHPVDIATLLKGLNKN